MKERRSITFGRREIEFTLDRAERKTLGLRVHPDCEVEVVAPWGASEEQILAKVRSKAAWILKQQAFFHSFYPLTPPRQYRSGETHLYLGRQYRLRVHAAAKPLVKLKGAFIEVWTPDPEAEKVKSLLENWYRKKAEIHFERVFKEVLPRFRIFELNPSPPLIRKMEKRWGSCSPAGRITLNLRLIQAPLGSIEYVIVHEVCHLIHPNHTAKFYALQEKMLPDWAKWKQRLEELLA